MRWTIKAVVPLAAAVPAALLVGSQPSVGQEVPMFCVPQEWPCRVPLDIGVTQGNIGDVAVDQNLLPAATVASLVASNQPSAAQDVPMYCIPQQWPCRVPVSIGSTYEQGDDLTIGRGGANTGSE